MSRWFTTVSLVLLVACGGGGNSREAHFTPPKPPNDDLIYGTFERRPPVGTTAIKFARDNSLVLAHERSQLDSDKPLATGSWKIDKDTLTVTYSMGMCADSSRTGTYKVVLSKVGIHFTKLEDECAQRAKIDGETWWRVRPAI